MQTMELHLAQLQKASLSRQIVGEVSGIGGIAPQECSRRFPSGPMYRPIAELRAGPYAVLPPPTVLTSTKDSQHPFECEFALGIFLMPQDILREAGSCREWCNSPERVPVSVVAVESTESIREDSRRTGRLALLVAVCDRRPVRRNHEVQLYHFGG
jgi:hypothetical protein